MLGERRSNSLFAPAAPAEPERKPEQAEVHDISFEERTGRSLFAETATAPRASELFFAPQEKGVTFAEALSQVQGYLSETYATLMDGRKANLVITDPPYNVNYEGSAGKIKNDNMASEKFFDFLFDAFSNMEKVMADDASIYVFHADTEGLNFRKAFDAAGFYLSGCCIWKKQSLVLGRSPYQWQHEPCLYGWKKKGKHQWYTGRKESTIWEFDKPKKNGDHPTMKPIPLLVYPIQNSSMANSVVLDPFGGSGSTLIACEQTDRICCTIELDEKFCDVIVKRYIEQVGGAEKVSVIRDGHSFSFEEVTGSEIAAQEGGQQ